MRVTLERHAQVQLVQGPWSLAQWAQTPPMLAPHTDGTTSPSATTQLASNSIPAGGTATRQVYQEGSHF